MIQDCYLQSSPAPGRKSPPGRLLCPCDERGTCETCDIGYARVTYVCASEIIFSAFGTAYPPVFLCVSVIDPPPQSLVTMVRLIYYDGATHSQPYVLEVEPLPDTTDTKSFESPQRIRRSRAGVQMNSFRLRANANPLKSCWKNRRELLPLARARLCLTFLRLLYPLSTGS